VPEEYSYKLHSASWRMQAKYKGIKAGIQPQAARYKLQAKYKGKKAASYKP
jgi:hypothetical protein